jgi:NAD(P)-dependent dehydrogenase (short-subunit alcohol dehydrogenase family)
VSLIGNLYTIWIALAYFREQGPDHLANRGKIVATGSTASLYPFPGCSLYALAKTGILGVVRALTPDVQQERITINSFAPSIVHTGVARIAGDVLKPFANKLEREKRDTPMETVLQAPEAFMRPESQLTGVRVMDTVFRERAKSI